MSCILTACNLLNQTENLKTEDTEETGGYLHIPTEDITIDKKGNLVASTGTNLYI